jgi:hypothetical protein
MKRNRKAVDPALPEINLAEVDNAKERLSGLKNH